MKGFPALFLWLLLTIPVAAQDFKTGLEAYDRGDFAAAIEQWRPLAEQGDARAQFNLGVIHFNGQGVPHDPVRAAGWYRAAAEQGYGPAQANLAFMHETGQGVLQNYVEAYKWLTLASRHGVDDAAAREKLMLKMTERQIAEGTQAAAAWRPKPPETLAQSATAAAGQSPDQAAAREPTREQVVAVQKLLAAKGFDAGPADGIAGRRTQAAIRAYQQSNGLPLTGEVSANLLAHLEGREDSVSGASVGTAPRTPPSEQSEEIELSAIDRSTQSDGADVAATDGDCDRLAAHPDDPARPPGVDGVPFQDIDAQRAVRACEAALARNTGNARYQLQYARSLHKAGRMAEAVTYYQQAGLQGHPLAQKTLGFAYANGLGVTQDYAKAAEWHHLAAEQGDRDAQHNLGFLYAGGFGVGQDFVQAYMWYSIAAAHGSPGAAAKRTALAGRMNDIQVSEAERRALTWFDLHPGSPRPQ